MEASKVLDAEGAWNEFEDWFQREVEGGLPDGEDRVADLDRCDYYLAKIADQEERAEEIAELMRRQTQRITDHFSGELATIRKRIDWLTARLRMNIPPSGEGMQREFNKKSFSLVHGTVGYRAKPATVRIVDQKAAVEWARANQVATQLKTTETVRVDDVKAWHERTGEVPPGCEHVDAEDRFFVAPSKNGGH